MSAAHTFFFVSERGTYYYHYVPHHWAARLNVESSSPPLDVVVTKPNQPVMVTGTFNVTIGRSLWGTSDATRLRFTRESASKGTDSQW